jgi:hypothetical protein
VATTQYDVYIAGVIRLAKTMLIKSEAVCDAINNNLAVLFAASNGDARYAVNGNNPSTWKYYLNLAGQYHSSDTVMTVISQDTLQTINFTPANLLLNTATAAAYVSGSKYYNDLVARYPTQELLIRGVLNPTPTAVSTAAPDGTVVWYDPTLVESNEMDLINDINRWVRNYLNRWNIKAYADVDDLYTAGLLGVMYTTLPSIILGLRLKYCHTYQTHSFHITQFLASNGKLDQFVASLTKPQMLWLYRNIQYIQRNPGANATFQSLIANILTARALPLSNWTMRHDLTNTQTTLFPVVEFQRGQLNLALADGGVQTRDVQQMLAAESPLAKDNDVSPDTVANMTDTMTYSLSDNLATKVLESSVLDLTDAAPYTLSDCLLNHWVYFAAINKYAAVVQVPNPKTGDTYTLSMSDAFVVYMYAFMVSKGLTMDTIPFVWANKVRKLVTPQPAEIMKLIDMSVVDASDLNAMYYDQNQNSVLPAIARTYISISAFNKAIRDIHTAELYQHALFSTQGHLWKRAYMETATLYLYTDYKCDLGAGQDYPTWFTTRGLDVPTLTTAQLAQLATSILVNATGADLVLVESLGDLLAASLKLMTQLSSYAVQYIGSINASPIKVIERASIRLGDINAVGDDVSMVVIPQGELFDFQGSGVNDFTGVTISDVSILGQEAVGAALFTMDLSVGLGGDIKSVGTDTVPVPIVGVMTVTDNLDYSLIPNLNTQTPAYQSLGLKSLPEAFGNLSLNLYPLTPDDQQTLRDRYVAWLEINGTPIGNLSEVLLDTTLPILATPLITLGIALPNRVLPPFI